MGGEICIQKSENEKNRVEVFYDIKLKPYLEENITVRYGYNSEYNTHTHTHTHTHIYIYIYIYIYSTVFMHINKHFRIFEIKVEINFLIMPGQIITLARDVFKVEYIIADFMAVFLH